MNIVKNACCDVLIWIIISMSLLVEIMGGPVIVCHKEKKNDG